MEEELKAGPGRSGSAQVQLDTLSQHHVLLLAARLPDLEQFSTKQQTSLLTTNMAAMATCRKVSPPSVLLDFDEQVKKLNSRIEIFAKPSNSLYAFTTCFYNGQTFLFAGNKTRN